MTSTVREYSLFSNVQKCAGFLIMAVNPFYLAIPTSLDSSRSCDYINVNLIHSFILNRIFWLVRHGLQTCWVTGVQPDTDRVSLPSSPGTGNWRLQCSLSLSRAPANSPSDAVP